MPRAAACATNVVVVKGCHKFDRYSACMRRSPVITLLVGLALAVVILIINHFHGAPAPYPGR